MCSSGSRLSGYILGATFVAAAGMKWWSFAHRGRWDALIPVLRIRPLFWGLITIELAIAGLLLSRARATGAVGAALLAAGGNIAQWGIDQGAGQTCGCVGASILTPSQHLVLSIVTFALAIRILLDDRLAPGSSTRMIGASS